MPSNSSKQEPIALAVAKFPYSAPDKRHLALRKHEQLKLLQQHESGWWIGENERGLVGFFPANYVQIKQWLRGHSPSTTAASEPTGALPQDIKWNKPMTHKQIENSQPESETAAMIKSLGFEADDMEYFDSDDEDDDDSGSDTEKNNSSVPQKTQKKEPQTTPQESNGDHVQSSSSTSSDLISSQQYKKLTEEHEQLKKRYEDLKVLGKENKEVQALKRTNKILQNQMQKLKEQLSSRPADDTPIQDRKPTSQSVPSEEVQRKIKSLEDRLKSAQDELQTSQKALEQSKKELQDREKQLTSLEDREKQLASESTTSKADSQESKRLHGEVSSLKKDISEKEKLIQEKQKQLDDVKEKLQQHEKLIEQQKEQIENLQKLKDDAESSLRELETTKSKAASLKENKLTKEFNSAKLKLEKELEDVKSKLEKQKQHTQQIKTKYAEVIERLDTELKRVKKELEEKTKRLDILEQQSKDNQKLAPMFKQLKSEITTLRSDQKALKQSSKQEISELTSLMKEFKTVGMKQLFHLLKESTDKYKEESKKRRLLFNELQDLKGKIRICVRVRPVLKSEESTGSCVKCSSEISEVRVNDHEHKKTYKYEFDKVFGAKSTQSKVFEEVKSLATSILDGYNVCIFAYGQTGSGKTHTMEGSPSDRGLNYRTINELFKIQEERHEECTYTFHVSVMEIYMESVYDLLSKEKVPLKLQMAGTKTQIPDLTQVPVNDVDSVIREFDRGKKNRAQACTDMNEHSSRSHCVVSVYVTGVNHLSNIQSFGKLHLIDLAGSERVKLSNVSGQAMEEAKSINSSLSALGDVISALGEKKGHIPYRNSKLTSVLQDSLGGNSKMMMFVNVSPCNEHAAETICSLKFANRVKKVELGKASKNVKKKDAD